MKRHIAKTNNVTFCGTGYTKYRLRRVIVSKRCMYLSDGITTVTTHHKRYIGGYRNPLPTTTYSRATCLICRKSFKAMALVLRKTRNIQELWRITSE